MSMETEEYSRKIEDVVSDPEYKPLRPEELMGRISVNDGDERAFSGILRALEKTGKIAFTKRGKVTSAAGAGLIAGVYHGTSKTFGFVTPDGSTDKSEDVFIPSKRSLYALDGDRVLIKLFPKDKNLTGRKEHFDKNKFRRGKDGKMIPAPKKSEAVPDKGPEGEIVRILERKLEKENVIGIFYRTSELRGKKIRYTAWVEPSSKRLPYSVFVDARRAEELGVNIGDKVEVKVTKFPSDTGDLSGEIINTFGDSRSKEANYAAILAENGIETEFPEDVLAEAEKSSERVLKTDGRRDLRDKIIFTIDGEDAKDLDDAISLDKTENGYILGVHIADVSEYVTAGSLTDADAMSRGTSVYFADKVVPMLPKCLSNGSCSLGGGLERYALSAFMTLDKSGNILETELCESIIKSRVRGVYSEINDIFENGEKSEFAEKYRAVLPSLSEMHDLYKILKQRSDARGALELDTLEAKIIVNEKGEPVDIVARERGDAEMMIEQFMLCANEGVATYLTNMSMPCVYRIHEMPTPEKVENFAAFARGVGLDTRPLHAKKLFPSAFTAIMNEAKEKGISGVVSNVMLRAMMKAKYSAVPSPHFGLSIDLYCHFTSPIRRYPDLSVHRIVKTVLRGEMTGAKLSELSKFAEESAQKSSENELRALSAERGIEDLYKVIFMQDKIGMTFPAVISSVTSFGIFAELPNTIEGMIPVETLDGIFTLDEKNYVLACGKSAYRIGQNINVTVLGTDISTGRITFGLADGGTGAEEAEN